MKAIILIPLWLVIYTLIVTFSFSELTQKKYFNFPPQTDENYNFKDKMPLLNVQGTQSQKVYANQSRDIRVETLKKFFSDINSPLKDHSEEIVRQADINGIDYALVPAISMQESNGCKTIPYDSYNCWGFGIYGSKITRFDSYEQAIARVSKIIKESYIKNGLTNPTLLEDRWAPPSRGNWSYAVNYFISQIHNLERNIPAS